MNKNKISKIICVVLCSVAVFSSCAKLSPNDLIMPEHQIDGLGDNEQSVKGDRFLFPSGITEKIQSYASSGKTADTTLGSGGNVEVLLSLNNTTSNAILVELPAAVVFQCSSIIYKNGLLIKKIRFSVPANAVYNVAVKLYCCNLARDVSRGAAEYIPIVSNTKEVSQFCDYFKNKAINYEDKHKDYNSNQTKIQLIVWDFAQYGYMPMGKSMETINGLP